MVDVVFVHGLNGDPHVTWTAKESKIFWPAQLLPRFVEEKARILTYGYDADTSSFLGGHTRSSLADHAEHLLTELVANRRIQKANERPLIFVAYSLGGLLVKKALVYSAWTSSTYGEHLRSVFVSTYGILFLGTPHTGSSVAQWGSRLERIVNAVLPRKLIDTQPQLVDALKKSNEDSQTAHRYFLPLLSSFHVYSFHEGMPTNIGGTLRYILNEESACLIVQDEASASPVVQDVESASINTNHSHICKFENDSAPGFNLVVEGIQQYASDAPSAIAERWKMEKEHMLMKRKLEHLDTEMTDPTYTSRGSSRPQTFQGSDTAREETNFQ